MEPTGERVSFSNSIRRTVRSLSTDCQVAGGTNRCGVQPLPCGTRRCAVGGRSMGTGAGYRAGANIKSREPRVIYCSRSVRVSLVRVRAAANGAQRAIRTIFNRRNSGIKSPACRVLRNRLARSTYSAVLGTGYHGLFLTMYVRRCVVTARWNNAVGHHGDRTCAGAGSPPRALRLLAVDSSGTFVFVVYAHFSRFGYVLDQVSFGASIALQKAAPAPW